RLGAGARLGPYEILRHCHDGIAAALYQGRDLLHGRPVALKILRPELADARAALWRFQQEAEVLGRLAHPNIVQLLGAGDLEDGRPFFVLEWLEGMDAARYLAQEGPLALPELVEVLTGVTAALEAAHAAGIVHRDLKAQNVMLLAGPGPLRVKLLDF